MPKCFKHFKNPLRFLQHPTVSRPSTATFLVPAPQGASTKRPASKCLESFVATPAASTNLIRSGKSMIQVIYSTYRERERYAMCVYIYIMIYIYVLYGFIMIYIDCIVDVVGQMHTSHSQGPVPQAHQASHSPTFTTHNGDTT